jgi:hypothetical protein
MDGRIRTLSSVIHIPGLARNLIYVSKMEDAGVKTMFEKETYEMVGGEMVFLKGVIVPLFLSVKYFTQSANILQK